MFVQHNIGAVPFAIPASHDRKNIMIQQKIRGHRRRVNALSRLDFGAENLNQLFTFRHQTAILPSSCSIVVIFAPHHSGRLARTSAAATGGQTAFPHRATWALFLYSFPR